MSKTFLLMELLSVQPSTAVKPGGESLLAAGSWCPGKNELATIRSHIQRNSSRLRRIINAPRFVKNFGPANPPSSSKKGRQNIFGRDDELKTAPKGIAKDHKWVARRANCAETNQNNRDIDLLKCRSFVVLHQFTDKEVLDPDFGQTVMEVVKAAKPLVYWCAFSRLPYGVRAAFIELSQYERLHEPRR